MLAGEFEAYPQEHQSVLEEAFQRGEAEVRERLCGRLWLPFLIAMLMRSPEMIA